MARRATGTTVIAGVTHRHLHEYDVDAESGVGSTTATSNGPAHTHPVQGFTVLGAGEDNHAHGTVQVKSRRDKEVF